MVASIYGYTAIAQALIARRASLDLQESAVSSNPYVRLYSHNYDLRCCPCSARSQHGRTALMQATGHQHTAIVEMLLEAGARLDLYDKVSLAGPALQQQLPTDYVVLLYYFWRFYFIGVRDRPRLCPYSRDEAPACCFW
jgi:ankyrin repeat protein